MARSEPQRASAGWRLTRQVAAVLIAVVAATTPSSVNGTPAATNAGANNNLHVLAAGCIAGLNPC